MEARPKRKPTGRHPYLRSLDNRLFNCPVSVCFFNMTTRDVDILWASYNNDYVHYCTLKPRRKYSISTYVGHPWIFEDSLTRDPMVVDGEEVWWPPLAEQAVVYIRLPVLPLQTLSKQTVRTCLNSGEDALKLDLPTNLGNHLKTLVNAVDFHRNRQKLNWKEDPAIREPTDLENERIILIALKLHEALSDAKDKNVSQTALMCIQLFLQYVQREVDPHHAAIQALLTEFETYLVDDNIWLQVHPVLFEHVDEVVEKLLRLVDLHTSIDGSGSVFNFIEATAVKLILKFSGKSNPVEK